MLSLKSALIATLVMALVIAFCRAVPFLFFRSKGGKLRSSFIQFVERSVPPVAMTVLAVSAIAGSVKEGPLLGGSALIAAVLTSLLHLWRRNALLSIVGGTLCYMLLKRIFML